MAFYTDALATRSNLLDRIATAFETAKADVAQRMEFRTTVRELSALTTRELNDLGISRSEIKRVAYDATYNK